MAQPDRRAAAGPAIAAWGLCLLIAWIGAASRYDFGYACDELQNVQFARNISRGLVPYRDFFEHHPPLFHYLTAPLVAGTAATDAHLLLVFRILAFLCLVLMACALARVCRACHVGPWAPWAAAAVLLTAPASTALYELRADWWGLTCFLGAIALLLEASSTTKAAWRRAAWAGILSGVALLFTQKAGMLLCGVGLWQVGIIAASRSVAQGRRRLVHALLFYAGVTLPVTLMLLFFARHGAVEAFVTHVVLINLHWHHELVPWTRYWSLAAAANPLVLALGIGCAAWTVLARHPRRCLRLAAGVASYIVTPVPYHQSLLFLVWPWTAVLAAVALSRYVGRPWRRGSLALPWQALALILCLAPLRWTIMGSWGWYFKRLAAALILAAAAVVVCRLVRTARLRAVVVGGLVLALAAYAFVDDVREQLRHSEIGPYMAAQAAAHKLLPPGIGVIEDWPTLAALHPSDYYGFQPGSVARDTCETVHLRALREGRAGAVIIDEDDLRKRYPRLAAYLDAHADRVGDSTQLLGKSLYLLRPTP